MDVFDKDASSHYEEYPLSFWIFIFIAMLADAVYFLNRWYSTIP